MSRTHSWRRVLPALALLAAIVAAGSLALLDGSSKPALPGGVQQSAPAAGFDGTLAQYRGKAVFVTFLYANCPDVCPLMASNLRVALNLLGKRASQAQLIAVSVDPRGDTPAAVARFVRSHELRGRMQYLIGSAGELARTWKAWSVGSTRDAEQPQLVSHDALVYGISASGKLMTFYPDSFEPREIAHDVQRLLAR